MTKRTFLTTILGTAGIVAAADQLRRFKSHTPMIASTNPVTVRLLDGAGALTDTIFQN